MREDPTDIHSDAYIYFLADDMFTANSEYVINQQLIISYLVYDMERLLFIGSLVPWRA